MGKKLWYILPFYSESHTEASPKGFCLYLLADVLFGPLAVTEARKWNFHLLQLPVDRSG
jgi:hypothetical protein